MIPSQKVIVIAGPTGSGKSAIIRFINTHYYPAIDLEATANHRGSVFGDLHETTTQPTQQIFEDELQSVWDKQRHAPAVFIEQEAPYIGKCKIPEWLWRKIEAAVRIQIHIPRQERVQHILAMYKNIPVPRLVQALYKLKDRLTEREIHSLENMLTAGQYEDFVDSILNYYDNTTHYTPGYAHHLYFDHARFDEIAQTIVQYVQRAIL
jgi:tRNA 2-selenouridine synthase